jgi:glutamate synthase (NADPH) small chain
MGKPTGFLEFERLAPRKASVEERVQHFGEFEHTLTVLEAAEQGARCMDCGTPFCTSGCPLGNLIPAWNDLVFQHDWRQALDDLHATNNFPEFTGRTCPAPCESACVLGINAPAVSIKGIENAIVERGWAEGWIQPELAAHKTGKRVAVVGSGPAGLAAAQQLARVGHSVTVFERDDRVGGLLTYGIPNFKLEKSVVERRVEQMRAEGVEFRTGVTIGGSGTHDINVKNISADELRSGFDAVVLATGSSVARDVAVEGRHLRGIHAAMDYLTQQNRIDCGDDLSSVVSAIPPEERINAHGKHVVVIGGGDTASDCIGTANRQGAASVTQLDVHLRGADYDESANPWWPLVPTTFGAFAESSSQREGCERLFTAITRRFVGDENDGSEGRVRAIECLNVGRALRREERSNPDALIAQGAEQITLKADLVLLAVGFAYPEYPVLGQFGVETTKSGTVAVSKAFATSQRGVFAAGDAVRGASLVVWAIAEGRNAARSVDEFLMGESTLPAPLQSTMVVENRGVAVY